MMPFCQDLSASIWYWQPSLKKKIGITLGEKALAGARLRLRVHASGRAKMKANWIYQAAKTS